VHAHGSLYLCPQLFSWVMYIYFHLKWVLGIVVTSAGSDILLPTLWVLVINSGFFKNFFQHHLFFGQLYQSPVTNEPNRFFSQGSSYVLKIVSSSENILSPSIFFFKNQFTKAPLQTGSPHWHLKIKAASCTICVMSVLLIVAIKYDAKSVDFSLCWYYIFAA